MKIKFFCPRCKHESEGQVIDFCQTRTGVVRGVKCTECGMEISFDDLNILNNKKETSLRETIDPNTKFIVGSEEYNDYYYSKKSHK